MHSRFAALVALLLATTAVQAQTPAGLVGRWRVVGPVPSLPPDADGPLAGLTFAADGSAEIAFTSPRAASYRLAAPLVSRGDTLVGDLLVEEGRRGGSTSYEVSIVGDDLALTKRDPIPVPRPVPSPPPVPLADGGAPSPDAPPPPPRREEVSILDFTRVDGAAGSLAGTWALASFTRGNGNEASAGDEAVETFTFTSDSLTIEQSVAIRVLTRGDSLTLYSGDAPGPRDGPLAYSLDGDALSLAFGWGVFHFERTPDAPPADQDPSALLGRWVPADVDGGAEWRILHATLSPDGRYVTASEQRLAYTRDFDRVSFSNGPGERADVYSFALNAGMLRLSRGRSEPILLERDSGEPDALVGRWTVAPASGAPASGAAGLNGLRAVTFGADGTAAFESVREQSFRLVGGRFEVSGSVRDVVHETDLAYRYRLRYHLDGGILTLSDPTTRSQPLRLRRDS